MLMHKNFNKLICKLYKIYKLVNSFQNVISSYNMNILIFLTLANMNLI